MQCKPIKSFGKQHMEDVEQQVNTREAVAPWCSIDLSSGNLTVVLEQYNCFDAEVYADELELDEPVEFREDQRSTFTSNLPGPMLTWLQSHWEDGFSATCSLISSMKKSNGMRTTDRS